MSGICGVVDFEASRIDPGALQRVAGFSAYRGPDGIGTRFLGPVGFAHLALHATAEEAGVQQPLVDATRRLCLVFDGRLDDRTALAAQLEPFERPEVSDAELVLAAYREWGEACTDRLLGDFAFAVWDGVRRRLFCAVDPLGLKPLHYARVGSLVCFASDALQVLQHPAVPGGYDEGEIAAYLASRPEDPERSFFAAVRRLAPAQRMIATREGLRVERYWDPRPAEIVYRRDEEYAAHFRALFHQAVTDRLRTSSPWVGVAMSGGLDSSSVAAVAHAGRAGTGKEVRAYTFVFDRLTDCDERPYSRTMTEELGLEVEPVEAERLWALEAGADLPHSPDTPFLGWRTCYAEVFRRMAARGGRVLLMGHGGDDLLRGSSRAYAERLRRGSLGAFLEVWRFARGHGEPLLRTLYRSLVRPLVPAVVERPLRALLDRGRGTLPSFIHSEFAPRMSLAAPLPRVRVFANAARQEVYDNLVGIPWYWRLANWHDRLAAAYGIEVRHPFLDRRLVEYVLAIPPEQLFRLGTYKNLLRRAMAGVLPEAVRNRADKTRFTSFLDSVLRQRSVNEILEILRTPLAAALKVVDGEQLRLRYQDYVEGGTDASRRALWYAITLKIWLRRCAAHGQGRTTCSSGEARCCMSGDWIGEKIPGEIS